MHHRSGAGNGGAELDPLTRLEVDVTADVDVRGALMVDQDCPVGFTAMRCRVDVTPVEGTPQNVIDGLTAAAERCCIVMNTLRAGVPVTTTVTTRSTE